MPFIKKYWKQAFALVISLTVILGIAHYTNEAGLPYFTNALVVWGTLVLATAAFLTIRNANERDKRRREEELAKEQRDREERLLNEIIEWAIDIQTNSLEGGIPLSTNLSVEQMRTIKEANSLLRYGRSFTKNAYIRAIANKAFRKDLKIEVEEAINIFTAFLFLKGSSFGMKNVKESFRGTATSIMDELEEKIKGNPKKLEELLRDYGEKIAISLNKLLFKAAKIKTKDIS